MASGALWGLGVVVTLVFFLSKCWATQARLKGLRQARRPGTSRLHLSAGLGVTGAQGRVQEPGCRARPGRRLVPEAGMDPVAPQGQDGRGDLAPVPGRLLEVSPDLWMGYFRLHRGHLGAPRGPCERAAGGRPGAPLHPL